MYGAQLIFIYSLVYHVPLRYEDYDFPNWANVLGWGLACISMVQIPIWAVVMTYQQPASSVKEVS